MQKLSACRNRASLIHLRLSTSSVCMIAIWPVGPPKLMKPSLSQKRRASRKPGCAVGGGSLFTGADGCEATRQSLGRNASNAAAVARRWPFRNNHHALNERACALRPALNRHARQTPEAALLCCTRRRILRNVQDT